MMMQWLPINDLQNQMENQNENGSRCKLLLPYIKGFMHHLYIKSLGSFTFVKIKKTVCNVVNI